MKKGDTVPVMIAGDTVAQAVVEKVELEERRVTLVIPATRAVMSLRVGVEPSAPEPVVVDETRPEHMVTGVDRYDAEGNIVSSTVPGETAPVVETPQSQPTQETPTGEATQTELVEPTPAPVEPTEPVVEPSED